MSETLTLRVLWASLFGTVGFLALLARVLPAVPAPQPGPLPIVFAAAAAGCGLMSFVLPALVYKTAIRKAELKVHEVPDPNAPAGFGSASRVRVFEEPARARKLARSTCQQSFVLGLSLSESVALFGFVLNRLGHPPLVWLPFFVVSGVLIVARFPREGAAEKRLERSLGARFP